jgi:hypothetical protein
VDDVWVRRRRASFPTTNASVCVYLTNALITSCRRKQRWEAKRRAHGRAGADAGRIARFARTIPYSMTRRGACAAGCLPGRTSAGTTGSTSPARDRASHAI